MVTLIFTLNFITCSSVFLGTYYLPQLNNLVGAFWISFNSICNCNLSTIAFTSIYYLPAHKSVIKIMAQKPCPQRDRLYVP